MAAVETEYTTWQVILYFSGGPTDASAVDLTLRSDHVTESGVLQFIAALAGLETQPGVTAQIVGGAKHVVSDSMLQLNSAGTEYA